MSRECWYAGRPPGGVGPRQVTGFRRSLRKAGIILGLEGYSPCENYHCKTPGGGGRSRKYNFLLGYLGDVKEDCPEISLILCLWKAGHPYKPPVKRKNWSWNPRRAGPFNLSSPVPPSLSPSPCPMCLPLSSWQSQPWIFPFPQPSSGLLFITPPATGHDEMLTIPLF